MPWIEAVPYQRFNRRQEGQVTLVDLFICIPLPLLTVSYHYNNIANNCSLGLRSTNKRVRHLPVDSYKHYCHINIAMAGITKASLDITITSPFPDELLNHYGTLSPMTTVFTPASTCSETGSMMNPNYPSS
jgi:hypothetical protein